MSGKDIRTVLILGGTAEASDLAEELSRQADTRVITSLAGRTKIPSPVSGERRIGGFGGVSGLVKYIVDENIDLLIDATHPFANRISENAAQAARECGVDFKQVKRPPWQQQEGDDWQIVKNANEAADALPVGARVFLALGSQHLKAFENRTDIHFIIRMVDKPDHNIAIHQFELVQGKPQSNTASEMALLQCHNVSHLVCRNSGGKRGYAKLEACRALGIKVVMIERSTTL